MGQQEVMEVEIDGYTAKLAQRLKTNPPKRKGERTRERIKLAAARVLERHGYHDMRVGDITKAARSSDGSFYIYFKDKKEVTLTVLREFLHGMQMVPIGRSGARRSPFEAIMYSNLGWIRHVRANAGLMRSVFQMSDEDSEFGRLVNSSNRAWHERVARSVVKTGSEGAVDPSAALFAAWSLGGMMDELMRRLVVYPDVEFVEFLEKTTPDDEALAAALAVIWHRVLYPTHQLPSDLSGLALDLSHFSDAFDIPDRSEGS